MNSICEDKSRIRHEKIEFLKVLSQEDRKKASFLMTERLLGHQWFYKSDCILAFSSTEIEIDTRELLLETIRLNKKLYLPKVCGNEMNFFEVKDLSELQKGFKGILEPKEYNPYCYSESNANHTLMIMPGVAFDSMKNRLGYGKGFYDRFLQDKPLLHTRTIAIGFKCQMIEQIPVNDLDIKPYQVLTF